MARSQSNNSEPSLFDELDEDATTASVDNVAFDADDMDDWVEVPQARFFSWSNAMQLHYCWRRDLDAAVRCADTKDASFFLERAAAYKRQLDALT